MPPEVKIEATENDSYSKVSLSNYEHIPNLSKYNAGPVYKYKHDSLEILELVLNFKVFEDDVWIITYPKCGTTWTQEMVWLLMNNMDFERAKSIDLEVRSPFLEYSLKNIEACDTLSRPRVLKTHELMQLLPMELWTKNPRILFVVRDPRDVFVSMYHHGKLFAGKTFNQNEDSFIDGQMKYGNFWEHVLSSYALKDKDNVMFMSFEQMKKNLKGVVLKVSDFLGKTYNELEIDKLVEHLDFKNMKSEYQSY